MIKEKTDEFEFNGDEDYYLGRTIAKNMYEDFCTFIYKYDGIMMRNYFDVLFLIPNSIETNKNKQ